MMTTEGGVVMVEGVCSCVLSNSHFKMLLNFNSKQGGKRFGVSRRGTCYGKGIGIAMSGLN